MQLESVELRDFRSYPHATAAFGAQLTIVHGPNGAGKSNLLEAVCFGCSGRSPRTRNERELIRFGTAAARVTLMLRDRRASSHTLAVGFGRLGEGGRLEKRFRFDEAPVPRLADVPDRPLISVFVPDRLELVTGEPALRRAHMDYLSTTLWPAHGRNRAEYSRALVQRNALIARMRSGSATAGAALSSWNRELARHALALMGGRADAVARVAPGFTELCERLGLAGSATLEYRPASSVDGPELFELELEQRLDVDLERGYTTHGPHRDELAFIRDSRQLRAYGSQGERRLSLLALLLAERAAIAEARGQAPLMLLDDVMSELDERRRRLLVEELAAGGGQSVIATTELAHVPDASTAARIAVSPDGALSSDEAR
jgi:DNA replication and repair protein RecF